MADRITISAAKLTAFKGNPLLTLNPDGRVNMGFGLGKGMLIAENLASIFAFLTSHGESITRAAELEGHASEFLRMCGYPAAPKAK